MLRIFAELMFKCVFFRYDNNTPWGEEKFIVPWSFMLWALSVCKTCKSEGKPIDILMLYFSRIGQLQQMMAAYIPMWCVCEYLCLPSFSSIMQVQHMNKSCTRVYLYSTKTNTRCCYCLKISKLYNIMACQLGYLSSLAVYINSCCALH